MLADSLACPGCKSKLRRHPALEPGTAVRCPRCGRDFALPEPVQPIPRLPMPLPAAPQRRDVPSWSTDPQPEPSGIDGLNPACYHVAVGTWLREACCHYGDMLQAVIVLVFTSALLGLVIGPVPVLGPLALAVLAIPVCQGPMIVALTVAQRRNWMMSEWFAGFARMPAFIGFYLLIGPASAACLLPVVLTFGFMETHSIRGRGDPAVLLVLMIGALVTSLFLLAALHARLATFGPQLIIDRGCGPIAAIRGCWRLSRGHFWGLCGFNLLLLLINLGGLVMCYIGVIFTLPLTQLAAATAYLHAVGKRRGPAAPRDPDDD